jgi:hypothetical protein
MNLGEVGLFSSWEDNSLGPEGKPDQYTPNSSHIPWSLFKAVIPQPGAGGS